MGIDVHALYFLKWAAFKSHGLGSVATLGRQSLNVSLSELSKVIKLPASYKHAVFCEELLKQCLGATSVQSFDNSNYEGADYVVDLNNPIVPPDLYQTVIDCGCLEHIYNIPQAFKNASVLCARGGQILHVLPANNYCGHGFWQFSPELFFSLYSEKNGYSETEVFIAELTDQRSWYEVVKPMNGAKAVVNSSAQLYVLCRTVKRGEVLHSNVQQSDYIFAWEGHRVETASKPKWLMKFKIIAKQYMFGNLLWPVCLKARTSFFFFVRFFGRRSLPRNPALIKRNIYKLIDQL